MAETMCDKADEGFQCYRPKEHEGPCALAVVEREEEKPAKTEGVFGIIPSTESVSYGWIKPKEYDVRLPSGSVVRLRVLNRARLVELNIMEMLDSFTPELLKSLSVGQVSDEQTTQALNEAMLDTKRREALLNPVNRVVLAAVVQPKVVYVGDTDETQINVHDVELEDRLAIFGVAFADQVDELKSVHAEPENGVGDVPEVAVRKQATL
jgi:hypothetical protein